MQASAKENSRNFQSLTPRSLVFGLALFESPASLVAVAYFSPRVKFGAFTFVTAAFVTGKGRTRARHARGFLRSRLFLFHGAVSFRRAFVGSDICLYFLEMRSAPERFMGTENLRSETEAREAPLCLPGRAAGKFTG